MLPLRGKPTIPTVQIPGTTALAAVHSNKGIAAFHERFRSNGKPFKVATTAVIRKRAILANTLITENRKWEPPRP